MNRIFLYAVLAVGVLTLSCEPEIDKEKAGGNFYPGNADFSAYIAIGNSITSGFADGELYRSGQINSFPAILAEQFEKVGGKRFTQPLMFDEYGFGNRHKLERSVDCKGNEKLRPVKYSETPDQRNNDNISANGPFHNLGVPGVKTIDLNDRNYSNLNKYFGRFAGSRTNSIMDEAAKIRHTFFTLWVGKNDVLLWAINGAAPSLQEAVLTPEDQFRSALVTTIERLQANGAKGVIGNVPVIEDLPFFNVIPYDEMVLTQEEANQLNLLYILTPGVKFKAGRNPFLIQDGAAIRHLQPHEKVVLTLDLDSVKCHRYGSLIPLPDKEVLTTAEIAEIHQAMLSYNSIISELAEEYSLALFDANDLFRDLSEGIVADGTEYTDKYVAGGFFSLDGLHPTPRGNAIIANRVIELINDKFRARIPKVDINSYRTVPIP